MLDAAFCNQLLDASLGTSTLSAPVLPVRCRLMVVNGTASVNGTELATGGGYTAATGAPVVTFAASSGENTANNTAVVVTNMPPCTVVGVELWDSSGTPRRLHLGALDVSKVVNLGDTFELADGELAAALS
jgi:hypothetical protein